MTEEQYETELLTVNHHQPICIFVRNQSSKNQEVRLFDQRSGQLQDQGFDPTFETGAIEVSAGMGGVFTENGKSVARSIMSYDEICTGIRYEPQEVGLMYCTVVGITDEAILQQFFKVFSCQVQRLEGGSYQPVQDITFPFPVDQIQKDTSPVFARFLLEGDTRLFFPAFPGNSTVRIDLCYRHERPPVKEVEPGQWHPDLPPIVSLAVEQNSPFQEEILLFDRAFALEGVTIKSCTLHTDGSVMAYRSLIDRLESSINDVGQLYVRIASAGIPAEPAINLFAREARIIKKNKVGTVVKTPLTFRIVPGQEGKVLVSNDRFFLRYLTYFRVVLPPGSRLTIDFYAEKSRSVTQPTGNSATH